MISFCKRSVVRTICIFCLLLLPMALAGQSLEESKEGPKQLNNTLSIVPQYAFYHGMRFDYERRIKNTDQWIVLAPQIFSDASSNNWRNNGGNVGYSSYLSMSGVGINAYYKFAAYKSTNFNTRSGLPRHILYVAAGPNFQYFSLKNIEEVPYPFIEDGITYYRFELEEVKKPVYRVGLIANMGWQLTFDRFALDLYFGLAIKYSMDGNGELINDPFAEWVDPAYTGVLLDGGVKVGFFF